MNSLTSTIGWCVVQVTLLCLFGLVLSLLLRRASSGASAVCTRSAMLCVFVLTLSAALPGWSWMTESALSEQSRGMTAATPASVVSSPAAAREIDAAAADAAAQESPESPEIFADALLRASAAWRAVLAGLDDSPRPASASSSNGASIVHAFTWTRGVLWLLFAAAALGAGRLLLGWAIIHRQVRRARPVEEPKAAAIITEFRRTLSLDRPVELRESNTIGTAAVVGWRRPVILLPPAWRSWSDDELRAVLAHELAHVARRHFPEWIAAQATLSLHFYHPLVHWLTRRLRLEQEFEADETAAAMAGGARQYVESLAALAIRQSDGPLAWPARAFLPQRNTFLRRIDMLRDTALNRRFSWPMRLGTVCVMISAGVLAAGLRAPKPAAQDAPTPTPGAPADVEQLAQANPYEAANGAIFPGDEYAAAGQKFLADINARLADRQTMAEVSRSSPLAWIPSDAVGVIVIRPWKLLAAIQDNESLKEIMPRLASQLSRIGQVPKQVTLVFGLGSLKPGHSPSQAFPASVILEFLTPADKQGFLTATGINAGDVREFAGVSYRTDGAVCLFEPDDRTLILDEENSLQRMILNGPKVSSGLLTPLEPYQQAFAGMADVIADGPFFAVMDFRVAASRLPVEASLALAPFSPLWRSVDRSFLNLDVSDSGLAASISLLCRNEAATARVQETLDAARVLLGNSLGAQVSRIGQDDAALASLLKVAQGVSDSITVDRHEQLVTARATVKVDPQVTQMLMESIGKARLAANQQRDQNSLKQIAIAMHMYHDANQHFPPAVVIDPKSKTPRSWRVELLPYLEQRALYEQYRVDEPWDSEANRRVLEAMPTVFGESGKLTSIMGVVGPGTVFSEPAGCSIRSITDGTSNTILFVQHPTKTVPWTKPEDAEIADVEWPVKFTSLGDLLAGDYNVAMCDGSVRRMIPNPGAKNLARWLIKSDGVPVQDVFSGGSPPSEDSAPIQIQGAVQLFPFQQWREPTQPGTDEDQFPGGEESYSPFAPDKAVRPPAQR